MQRLKEKKYGVIFFLIVTIFFIGGRQKIDRTFSGIVARAGGETCSNMDSEMNAIGEVLAGDVLCQRLYLEEGALAVGVRIGTYVRSNDSHYIFTVYDVDGNVLGKKEISALEMLDNQMCYISLYARTSIHQNYYLIIESLDAVPGNAVTCYGVKTAQGHESITWNDTEVKTELVTEVLYQKIFPVTRCMLVGITLLFLIYIFYSDISKGICFFAKQIWNLLKKYGRKTLVATMGISVLGVLLLFLFPKNEYDVLRSSLVNERNIKTQYYTEKWSQIIEVTESFDAIEVKLGTYTTSYTEGSLVFSVYDINADELLVEKRVPAQRILDNRFLCIETGQIAREGIYRIELWTEDFAGQPLALYCTEDGESLIFHLLRARKEYRVLGIFMLILVLALAGVIYFCLFVQTKGKKNILVVALLSVVAGIVINTYGNYKKISLEALAKNLGLFEKEKVLVFNEEQIEKNTERNVRYRSQGVIYSINDLLYLNHIYERVDSITLYFADEGNMPLTNTISVHADTDNGFSMKAEIDYEYIYKGQKSICIPVGETEKIDNLILGISAYARYGGNIPTADFQWYALEKIVLNESAGRLNIFHWTFILGFLIVWIFYACQYFKVEKYLEKLDGKNAEVKIFVVLALIFGLVMSFLLPAYQTPDEPHHVRYTLASIGAEDIANEMDMYITEAIGDVTYHSGNQIILNQYAKYLSSHLSSYPTKFSVHMEILKYPGAVLGTFLGLLFRMPVGGILFFGEFFALLLYVVLGAMAIYLAPIKKKLFMVLLLLPIGMQQAASYSYDSFNNVLSILTIAYCLYLSLQKKKIGLKDLARLGIMLFLLLYIKKVYVLCGFLLVFLPWKEILWEGKLEKWLNNKRKKCIAGIVGTLTVFIGFVIMLEIIIPLLGIEKSLKNVFSLIYYPKEVLVLMGMTLVEQFDPWIKQFSASFGWLEGIAQEVLVWAVFVELFVAALFTGNKKDTLEGWNRRKYLFCVGIFMMTIFMIMFSMLGWTQTLWPVLGGTQNQLLMFEIIEGVQGRYFIPIIVLLFLFPVSGKIQNFFEKRQMRLYLLSGWILIVSYAIFELLDRYWICF